MEQPTGSPHRRAALAASIVLAAVLAGPPAATAQETPFVPDEWRFGRQEDKGTLRYCIDPRDPEWTIARDIAEAIAGALLLVPAPEIVTDRIVTAGWDPLYRHLLADCDVYFGFKLIPGGYPGWLALSRAYYSSSYVLAVKEPGWASLADIPAGRPIGTAIATTADFSFIKYLQTLPPERRWQRFPMGDNEAALAALREGTVAAALVWGPAVWALRETLPADPALRLIATEPLATTSLGMGAALLANQSFLRDSVDRAIAALAADGTIQAIIDGHGFPAEVEP